MFTFACSIVMSKPEEERTLFQFLDPLSPIVWLLLLAVFLLISGVLYLVDRITPSEESNVRFGIQVYSESSSLSFPLTNNHC